MFSKRWHKDYDEYLFPNQTWESNIWVIIEEKTEEIQKRLDSWASVHPDKLKAYTTKKSAVLI